ncbi:PLP-dependent aminotransferase family protein [Pleurocapsa sp. PCC 7319]|uniref:aminotransferase-like domain-containing protein n=1 Tax=Pleurocapsa sp. PCC 7319 TaxID=118161 RepID=UPI000344E6BC|nr:PLP-dependent aminotransferase family protein [Pleurocapsa sp. PCC 7319]
MIDKSLKQNLYEQVADRFGELINKGTLQPGDRLPSVRKLHQQLSVSISTISEAYRLLEDRGLITVRPQSGYYVKTNITVPEPNPSAPPLKVSNIDTSIIARVYADIARPQIVKLGAAIPSAELLPLKTLNRLMSQVIRTYPEMAHSYQVLNGCEILRHEIARKLIDAGCSISPEQILITNGTTEAIYLALRAVTKPGDTIVIESPSYYGLLQTLELLHLKAVELPTDPREGICLESLETVFKNSSIKACALVSNFSNPLGSCMSDRRKQDLVALLNKYDVSLVEDDIYGDLSFNGHRPKAIKAFDTQGRVLYCSSVSKTLSPGLRVGWLVAERHLIQVQKLKMVTNVMTSVVPQLTVATFLANGGYERHLRKLRRTYHSQMEKMRHRISDYFPPQTRMTQPQGGQVLWLELPQHFDVMQFYEAALKYQISIAPGIIFSPTNSYRNCLRLNFGLLWSEQCDYAPRTDKVDRALEILGALAQQQLSSSTLLKIKR